MPSLEDHVSAAVEALLAAFDPALGVPPAKLAAAVHARLWPYVEASVGAVLAGRDLAVEGTPADRRARPWQYVARFWKDHDLIGETDPTMMQGTGALPGIVYGLARELHPGALLGKEIEPSAIKDRLPQLRNNLGRAHNSTLQITYSVNDVSGYLCQVEVYRLS